MQCSTCGNSLPTGAPFCTNCGAKVYSQGRPGSQPYGSQVEPTIAAYPYVTPPNAQSPGQPSVPPIAYGAPSYNSPQQYSFEAPSPPPPPYTYGVPPIPPSTYGTPPSYGTPFSPPPGSYIPPGQQPPARRKGPGVGLIIGIVVLLLLVVGGGILALRAATSSSKTNTNTPTVIAASPTTPAVTPTTQAQVPSGVTIDPAAAAIVTKAQTAIAIDSNDFPTQVTSNFKVGQDVYVTFNLATNGKSGYVEAKLYGNTSYVGNKILPVQSNYDHGYFTVTLNRAAIGTTGLYWCLQSDCSDAKLATFVTFNVA